MEKDFKVLDNDEKLINIWGGEFPRLTYINIITDMRFLREEEIVSIE